MARAMSASPRGGIHNESLTWEQLSMTRLRPLGRALGACSTCRRKGLRMRDFYVTRAANGRLMRRTARLQRACFGKRCDRW